MSQLSVRDNQSYDFDYFSLATPSGLTSIPAGLETPEMIQLRLVAFQKSILVTYQRLSLVYYSQEEED